MYLDGSPKPITGYRIQFDAGGTQALFPRVTVRLTFKQQEVAAIEFVDDGVPTPTVNIIGDKPVATCPVSLYLPLIDMLRNEKPINAALLGGAKKPDGKLTPFILDIRSGDENVGEGEPKP